MNVFLLTQYYPPEPGSASMRMGEVAEYLAGKGHEVTVVTGFPNYPDGKVELTRFSGLTSGGVHYAKDTKALPTGVQKADGGAGESW